MGSSKRSRDKDKKKSKRDVGLSESRSKEREQHRHHHKHKKHKRREERSPSISLSDISDIETEGIKLKKTASYSESPPAKVQRTASPSHPHSGSNDPKSAKEIALSIEETNKIRAKLGLKPLQLNSEKTLRKGETENDQSLSEYTPGEILHKPAENLRDKVEVEKLREKIALQREKRRLNTKLKKTKTLGDSDDDSFDALVWVQKSRGLAQMKKEAEARDKMLDELDAQFGVDNLIEEEFQQKKERIYTEKNLVGLKVQHDMERFSEGQATILTLKDSNILDGAEDTLVNVNIEDLERAEMNVKLRKLKPNEPEYDAPEVDNYGNIVQNTVLGKYDEEIYGEKKKSFSIGKSGKAMEITPELKLNKLRMLTSLSGPETQLATEYLTPSEMVSFKKKKRRKKKPLTADDLIYQDHSSRNAFTAHQVAPVSSIKEEVKKEVKSLRELMEEEEEEREYKKMEIEEDFEEDVENYDTELQEALARSRRSKLHSLLKSQSSNSEPLIHLEKFAQFGRGRAFSSQSVPLREAHDDASMTLNITDEFCRSLGDIPTYGLAGNRAEEDAIQLPGSPPRKCESLDAAGGTWAEVHIEDTKVEISNDRNIPILEEEPDTGRGVVNALKLAARKGYLETTDKTKPVNATLQHLRAIHYSIEDKAIEDDRRAGGRGSERYVGPTMDFRDKDGYKPEVKLEYVDDEGRKLNAKEAFRYLSHKFHGKGSGKNKMEKRMKKWQEDLLMKHMNSNDTPLQTLEKQKEKQKQLGTAFLLLSGNKPQESLDVKK